MAKIISVYIDSPQKHDIQHRRLFTHSMAYGRWLKIAEALQRHGHQVDLAVPDRIADWYEEADLERSNHQATESTSIDQQPLGMVPFSKIHWPDYDVVKTAFHKGFETLTRLGGAEHPFIISKLGSVVGPEDRDGIYFYGEQRKSLFDAQCRINEKSRYITILSEAARDLWTECHGRANDTLLVPGGVDSEIPVLDNDPYPDDGFKRVIFAGNVYGFGAQMEANRVLIDKLNHIGEILYQSGTRLYLLGYGQTDRLNPTFVSNLGAVSYDRSWTYLGHADLGIVVSAGPFMHNNESSKIYHYLRAGLPVVSESGFPNDHVIRQSEGGFLVDGEDMREMAHMINKAIHTKWDRAAMIRHVLDHHTWDSRAEIYRKIIESGH